jgi:phosphate-selective porin OprO/OprP
MKRATCLTWLVLAAWLPGLSALTSTNAEQDQAKDGATKKKKKKKKHSQKDKKNVTAADSSQAAAANNQAGAANSTVPADEKVVLDDKYKSDMVETKAKKYFRFEFTKHPAIRLGKWLRVDFRLKFQHDFRSFDPEVSGDEGETSNLRKFRVGIEGYVTKNFEYSIEREIRNEVAELFNLRTRETHALWRDVYGNFRYFRRFQIRVGQFKIPFGMDQLHYSSTGEFVNRSLIGNYLAPGRELGVMLHGKLFESNVAYQVGVFVNDGWKAHTKDYERSGERTFAGRVVLPPFAMFNTPHFLKPFKDLQLGAAFTESPLTEGLRSLRGRTWVITHNWFDRIYVRGQRLRLGAELNWEPGPFVAKGEVIRVSDQRIGQGLRNDDLPDLIARGWYFTTGWVITGEKTAGGVVPRREFVRGHGFGAVQIVARYEQMRFGSADHPGLPSRSTRAANIYSESERIATFGVNWYLNRFVRVQYNAIREVIEDVQKAPILGQSTYWSRYVRIQFVM